MDIGEQAHIKWSLFFDVESMKRFAPVIELEQFFNGKGFMHFHFTVMSFKV
jgi:hypothetical protein